MTKDNPVPGSMSVTLPRTSSGNVQLQSGQKPIAVAVAANASASATMPRKADAARLALCTNGANSASCDQLSEVGMGAVPVQVGRKGSKPQRGLAGQAAGRNTQRCVVTYLDGTQQHFFADPEAPGGALFEAVCDCLAIMEREYFGMTFRSDQDTVWLDRDKKLIKQTSKYVFDFRVKFYPADSGSMREDITRYYVACQVRQDILEGKLPCSFLTYAILGSYIVQADVGDFDPNAHIGISYVLDQLFAPEPLQSPELLERIVELHRGNKGQTPEEADTHYLENATKLSFYGMHLTPVKDLEGDDVQVGIYHGGIVVYRNFLRIVRFSWPKIIKISFLRNKFIVRRRPTEGEASEVDEMFKLTDYKRAKRLWKLAVEHHTFFRMRETDAPARPRILPRIGTMNRNATNNRGGRTQYQMSNPDQFSDTDQCRNRPIATRQSSDGNWGTLPDLDRRAAGATGNPDGLANERHTQDIVGTLGRAQAGGAGLPRYASADGDSEMRRPSKNGAEPCLFGVPPQVLPAVQDALRRASGSPDTVGPGGITEAAVVAPLPDTLGGRSNFTNGRFEIERPERFAARKTLVRVCVLPRGDVDSCLRTRNLQSQSNNNNNTDLDDEIHDRELELAILSVTGVDPHASVIDHHQTLTY